VKESKTSKEYILSKSQLDTLFYWAYAGQAARRKWYITAFPQKLDPHIKLTNIAKVIGYYK